MRTHQKRYLLEVVPALLLFGLALLVPHLLSADQHETGHPLVIALLPLPPLIWAVIALMRRLLAKDELEQRIELIAIAISSASVGLGCFVCGQLADAQLLPQFTNAHVVVPSGAIGLVLPWMLGVYGAVKLYLRWRYR